MKVLEPSRFFRSDTSDPALGELRAGLQLERKRGPDPEQRARMRAALGLPSEPPAPPTAADRGATVTPLSAARPRGWWVRRVITTGVVLALGTLVAWFALQPPVDRVVARPEPAAISGTQTRVEPAPPEAVAPQAPPSQVASQSTAGVTALQRMAAGALAAAPRTGNRRLPPKAATTIPTASDDPEGELRLLKRARARVHSEPAAALELLAQHEREFPAGMFVEEREVIAIDALLARGDRSAAQARATRFSARHPGSAHTRRVQELIGAKPASQAR